MRMLRRVLARWADAAARAEIEDMKRDARLQQVEIEALRLEKESLAAVVARDRQRVAAETQEFSERMVKAGG